MPLPVLDQAYYAGDRRTSVPDAVDADLAELVGYFMGDGSLHAEGHPRFCVADADLDVVERHAGPAQGALRPRSHGRHRRRATRRSTCQSVRLARWWKAAGFAKRLAEALITSARAGRPRSRGDPRDQRPCGLRRLPARPLRGRRNGPRRRAQSCRPRPRRSPTSIRTVMLALGLATTTRETVSGWGGPIHPGAAAQPRPRLAIRRTGRLHRRPQEALVDCPSWSRPKAATVTGSTCRDAAVGRTRARSGTPRRKAVVDALRGSGASVADTGDDDALPRSLRRSAGPRARLPVRAGGRERRRRGAADLRPVGARRTSPMSPPGSSATTPSA